MHTSRQSQEAGAAGRELGWEAAPQRRAVGSFRKERRYRDLNLAVTQALQSAFGLCTSEALVRAVLIAVAVRI